MIAYVIQIDPLQGSSSCWVARYGQYCPISKIRYEIRYVLHNACTVGLLAPFTCLRTHRCGVARARASELAGFKCKQ
eukprot:365021-Chlamydomonas_euryale.AAC.2